MPFLNGYGAISIQTYPHYECHCYDDMMSKNEPRTPGYQPETLQEFYSQKLRLS